MKIHFSFPKLLLLLLGAGCIFGGFCLGSGRGGSEGWDGFGFEAVGR